MKLIYPLSRLSKELTLTAQNIPAFLHEYYERLLHKLREEYERALEFRRRTRSPTPEIESIFADSIPERVELLVGPRGIAEKIRELMKSHSSEQLAFKLAEEIVSTSRGRMSDEALLKQAISTALAILTPPCITAAPTEGISHVKIKTNPDGSKYLAIYFAGPIRSAGGTELAAVVVLADYVRRLMGLDRYKPTEEEVKRFVEELRTYVRRVSRFQYNVPDSLIEYAIRMTPVEISGVATDKILTPSYRNLPRIETNYLRGGALRVVNDGIVGRAKKVLKMVQSLNISGWEWIEEIVKQSKNISKGEEGGHLSEVIGGRPVFSLSDSFGGFRIRYGRSFATGMAALGVHPMTMRILDGYIVLGTQLKTDYPGKGGVVIPVDVEPPVVKTSDGEVVRIDCEEKYARVAGRVEQILFLGDVLISAGDCIENNVELRPPGYCEEWWAAELGEAIARMGLRNAAEMTGLSETRLRRFLEEPLNTKPTFHEALAISKTLGTPLHPSYTFYWENITIDELEKLRRWLSGPWTLNMDGYASIKAEKDIHEILTSLLVEHRFDGSKITIRGDVLEILQSLLRPGAETLIKGLGSVIDAIAALSGVRIRPKSGSFITARMGRPEKAGPRMMDPAPHVLYPIGLAGGSSRDLHAAAKSGGSVVVEMVMRKCSSCGGVTWKEYCDGCGGETVIVGLCSNCQAECGYSEDATCPRCGERVSYSRKYVLNMKQELEQVFAALHEEPPGRISGVKGLTSLSRQPEMLVKGVLRAKYGLFVYKDGTTRFDATNAPLTHFTPRQIGVSVERLRELGYTHDINGLPLVSPDQVCELRIQDIIISRKAAEYLLKVSRFIDDLLSKVAGLERYYNYKHIEDLIGCLVVALSPHTYVGVLCRVIGFVDGEVNFAHPILHAAKRRDCDGDEDSVMLLMDVLMNFSRLYIPDRVGGKMDSPLLITRVVYPEEVDEQAHNVDICSRYPLAFYEAASKGEKAANIVGVVETIKDNLAGDGRFAGMRFTHQQKTLTMPMIESAYKRLETMLDKVMNQLELTSKLSSVKTSAIAEKIVQSHILPDILGNIRAFFVQSFRCKKCGKRYRRLTLTGKCPSCQSDLVQTVFRGAVEKYVELAEDLARRYVKDEYLHARTVSAIGNITDSFVQNSRLVGERRGARQASLESFFS